MRKIQEVSGKLLSFVKNNVILSFFIVLALFFYFTSGLRFAVVGNDVSARFFRNMILILSLIPPIMAGVGLNFGIVLGAMSAQISIIIVIWLGLDQSVAGYVWCALLIVALGGLFGYLLSLLFNRTKGQEMVAGLMVGYFSNGLYQLLFLVFVGGVLLVTNLSLVMEAGGGIKSTISLSPQMAGGLDKLFQLTYFQAVCILLALTAAWCVYRLVRKSAAPKPIFKCALLLVLSAAVFALMQWNAEVAMLVNRVKLPVVTLAICGLVIAFISWIQRTKLGQDFNSIRSNMDVAAAMGIDVDKSRTIALMMSTVIAGFGQLIYIQNLGTFATYTMHTSVSTISIAAILIGGATIRKVSIKNALIGNLLFQTIYSTAPTACRNLTGNSQIGEYFRTVMCYGIIAVAMIMYISKEIRQSRNRLMDINK